MHNVDGVPDIDVAVLQIVPQARMDIDAEAAEMARQKALIHSRK